LATECLGQAPIDTVIFGGVGSAEYVANSSTHQVRINLETGEHTCKELEIVTEAVPATDYSALEKACKGSGCCLSSVKRMKEGGYGLAPGKTLAESGCPEGTKPDMLKCIDSYRWCVPE